MIEPLVELPPTPEHAPPGTLDSAPGDRFPMDADVTVYWPSVRMVWEES